MELNSISSKMETGESAQLPQEPGINTNVNTVSVCDGISAVKTFKNEGSSACKEKDFRHTAKYNDSESYSIQHHHSIGTGLYLTEEVMDLPPRFRTKVIQAVESLAARNNVPLTEHPLKILNSQPCDSRTEERNPDPLVFVPDAAYEIEKRLKNEKFSEPVLRRDSKTKTICNSNHTIDSDDMSRNLTDQKYPKQSSELPHESRNFSKNKTNFNSESQRSGNYRNKDNYKRNPGLKRTNSSQTSVPIPPPTSPQSDMVQPEPTVQSFQIPFNIHLESHSESIPNLNFNSVLPEHGFKTPNLSSDPLYQSEDLDIVLAQTAHISYYNDLNEKGKSRSSDVIISVDERDSRPRSSRHKSNSTSRSSCSNVNKYEKPKNTLDSSCTENNFMQKVDLNVMFPNMKFNESDRCKKMSPTTLEDNSHLQKLPKKLISKNHSHSVYEKEFEESNRMFHNDSAISSNLSNERNGIKKKFTKQRMREKYKDDEEGQKLDGSQNSLNSLSKCRAENSYVFNRNKSFKNPPQNRIAPNVPITSNESEKCHFSKPKNNQVDDSNVKKFPNHRRHNSRSSTTSSYSSKSNYDNEHFHKDNARSSIASSYSSTSCSNNDKSAANNTDKLNKRPGHSKDHKYSDSNFASSSFKKPMSKQLNFGTSNESLKFNDVHNQHMYDKSKFSKSRTNIGYNKECRNYHSNQTNRDKEHFSATNSYSSVDSQSNFQDENYARRSYTRGCVQNGFFVKLEVFENRDLEYWLKYFRDIFPFPFELELCCHFSDILILEFERREHAAKSLSILEQEKKKMQNSRQPLILSISTILFRLVKPCNCEEKVINDALISIKKHFECSLSIINKKKEEIQNFKPRTKHNSGYETDSTKRAMLKSFSDSEFNFEKFKEQILTKIKDANNLRSVQLSKYSFIRECNAFTRCLPIYSKKREILALVKSYPVSVIVAETGSGKSTQLVQYIYHADPPQDGLIICTQPRKLAAISIAQFVSGQIGSAIGKIVGYDVGIEKKSSDLTKIVYMTDYCLLKLFLRNKDLRGISCIIIDEAHERSLYTDLILGMLKNLLSTRPDLRVVITSATINPEIFIDYFNMPEQCVLDVPGRSYPVDVIWFPEVVELGWDYVTACVEKVYDIHVKNQVGDILVFLTSPGEAEEAIFLLKQRLRNRNDKQPDLFCLHGKTDIKEQMEIFEITNRGSRKIVFATNVAETAVTIPRIKYVVDSGMSKELMFDPKKNKSYLAVTFITKSAAEQRKGRAGRTQSGICFRMYSKRNYSENMPDNAVPEILKTNLQKALLKIFELGIDPEKFDFLEAPPQRTISNSIDSLEYLGAIENRKLTEFGRRIAKLPLEPHLSKLILQGIEVGIGYETIVIAALVSESGKLFIRNAENRAIADEKKRKFCQEGGDLCTYLEIFKRWKEIMWNDRFKWCVENYISNKALKAAEKSVFEVIFSCQTELKLGVSKKYNQIAFKKHYEKILFDSFSENLCVLSGHPKLGYLSPYLPESFFIHPSSTLSYLGKDSPEFLVYNTLMETSRNFLFDVTPISEETIKMACQTGNFKLPLYSLKCLQVPPKVLGPFGESVLIRYILGKKGSKIQDLETKIQQLTKVKNIYVDVAVDKGLITIYVSQRFHEKVSTLINQIIKEAQLEMLKEEDVAKLSGTSMYFALSAGGIINDIIMPGEFREIVVVGVEKDSSDLERTLESFGSLQLVSQIKSKQGKKVEISATYKKVGDAQKAFLELNKRKYVVSGKPYLQNVSDKTSPLNMLNISWCRRPCNGNGSVEFFSMEDLIIASGILTYSSFYLENNLVIFSPAEKYPKELSMRNLPKTAEEKAIRTKLNERLPKDLNIKDITIDRQNIIYMESDVKDAREKLSKLIMRCHVPKDRFVIEIQDPRNDTSAYWNASVYCDNSNDVENAFMKLKNSASINAYPLSVKKIFKSSLYCNKKVFNFFSQTVTNILAEQKTEGLCYDFNVKEVNTKCDYQICVEFSFLDLQGLNKTKQNLRQYIYGEALDFIGKPTYHFLFSESHKEHIEKIKALTKTFITLNSFRKVITIYGSSSDCHKAKEEIFALVSNPNLFITRTFNLTASCIPMGFLKKLYSKYGYDLHGLIDKFKLTFTSIDNFGRTLTLKGSKDTIKKAEQALEKLCEQQFESRGERKKKGNAEELCAICFDPVSYDFQRLEHCGHAFCRQCLLLQIESKTVPLVCVKQGCEKLIVLEDIKRIIASGETHLKKLFCSVALQHHVTSNIGKLSYCPTPDCQMIYRVTEQGSEYICSGCRNSTCTHCQAPYHHGMSCEMFQNCQIDKDYSLKAWMKENESMRKYCPSCKTVIEKDSGCNHMECLNCKAHLCWLCLRIFPSGDEVYEHLPVCPRNQTS